MSVLDLKTERRTVVDLRPHPLSHRVFGQLPQAQFDELKADIARRGIQHPPEVDANGLVICGSQRVRALKELNVHAITVLVHQELREAEAIEEYLLLDNVQRRQLTPGQMYRAGKELERIESAKAMARQRAGPGPGLTSRSDPGESGKTTDRVAEKMGTSGKTFERLRTIYEKGSVEIQDQVDSGMLSISAAAGKVTAKIRTGKARRLDGDDSRTHALRWARLQHDGNRLRKFLDDHCVDDFGGHRAQATAYLTTLAEQLIQFASIQSDESAYPQVVGDEGNRRANESATANLTVT